MKKLLIVLLIVVINNTQGFNQASFSSVIPPSPEAVSLGKYADFPVNLYNGIPNIDIPIWTIEVGGFKMPISLSYQAGGIKVEEIASWVGLGWTLNAGGVITRSAHGKPDDGSGGYVNTDYIRLCPETMGSDYYDRIARGELDSEPDEFFYNFCGISGKFVLDHNGNCHSIPYSNIKIIPTNGAGIEQFTITTEDGIQFLFSERETQDIFCSTIDQLTSEMSGSQNINYTASWYLTKISFPNKPNVNITFTYNSYTLFYSLQNSESFYVGYPNFAPEKYPVTTIDYVLLNTAKRILSISFPNGVINFSTGALRHDLQGSQVLDKITINQQGSPIRNFKFFYNYFSGSGMKELSDLPAIEGSTKANTDLRLSLKSLQEYDGNMNQSKNPYVFSYENSVWLPNRLTSKALDHWGFYNGENANTTLIPAYYVQVLDYVGGLRNPNVNYAKAGMLKSIQYPVKGSTTFTFELNEAGNSQILYSPEYVEASCELYATNTYPIPATFAVNNSLYGNKVTFDVNFSWSGLGQAQYKWIDIEVLNISNPSNPTRAFVLDKYIGDVTVTNYTTQFTLNNGTYKIRLIKHLTTPGVEIVPSEVDLGLYSKFSIKGLQYKGNTIKTGGLRISKIVDYDPVSGVNTVKKYEYKDDDQSTSGIVYSQLNYSYQYAECKYTYNFNLTTDYTVYTSLTQLPLTYTKGGQVGYSKVSVLYGQDNAGNYGINGKTDYYYSNVQEDWYGTYTSNLCVDGTMGPSWDRYFPGFPFAPAISGDYARGNLTKQVDYRYNNGAFVKVKEIINTYKNDYTGNGNSFNKDYDILGLKVGVVGRNIDCPQTFNTTFQQYYYYPIRLNKLIKTEEICYDVPGTNPMQRSQEEYAYDNLTDIQLTRKIKTKSDGNKIVTEYLHPHDFISGSNDFIKDMKDANIIDKPIEIVNYITDASGGNAKILSGKLTTYKQGTLLGLPDKDWVLENQTPITLGQFRFSNQSQTGILPHDGTPITFSISNKDSHYPQDEKYSYSYDNCGNIATVNTTKDVSVSYVWGYNNTLPIAKVLNCTSNNLYYKEFYYANQSFTPNVTTGIDYILQYYYLNGTTWIFKKVNKPNLQAGPITITDGSSYLSDIYLYPANAKITTYTYDPLIGMTSSTDENNVTTYYEYDSFGRLIKVKDDKGNILKQYEYHYKQ